MGGALPFSFSPRENAAWYVIRSAAPDFRFGRVHDGEPVHSGDDIAYSNGAFISYPIGLQSICR